MKLVNPNKINRRNLLSAFLLFCLTVFGNAAQIFAHGGEDHGDEKPKTATTTAGTVTRSARLGDFEIMLKHSPLEPDAVTAGRLFVTKFATNEPVGDANLAVEIEAANGIVTEIPIEKSGAAGSYTVKIPALPEGTYTLRAKAAAGGKINTATFSSVEIAHQEAATAASETGGSSWTQTSLIVLLLLIALALFGSLAYFARRVFNNKPLGEKTVSA